MSDKTKSWGDYLIAVLVAILGFGLLKDGEAVSQGIQNGLKICANVLIPALFPFMALSSLLSLTSAARILSVPLKPVTTRIFKLPAELGAVVLLSLVGGFPVGAKSISLLLSQKKITSATAERMLCFCVNSGPSFLITAVGVGMLLDKTAGIILFITQTVATLIIGAAVSFRSTKPETDGARVEMRGTEAVVAAVSSASQAMLAMCSFAVLFSGILSLISASGIVHTLSRVSGVSEMLISAVLSGIFEVTAGCASAARIGGELGFGLISAAVSFCGLSVLFQIISCFRDSKISFKSLIMARISHMLLSTFLAVILYRMFCKTQIVFAPSSQPILHYDAHTAFISVCLLCMCVIMTLAGRKI